jgi:hypothetical protein
MISFPRASSVSLWFHNIHSTKPFTSRLFSFQINPFRLRVCEKHARLKEGSILSLWLWASRWLDDAVDSFHSSRIFNIPEEGWK